MELDEQTEVKKTLKPNDIVFVYYRGCKIPMKAIEVGVFKSMTRKEKGELLTTFLRITRKSMVVKKGIGYVRKRDGLQ